MTQKYLIVNKTTNKIDTGYYDNTTMPIDESVLQYIEAPELIVNLLDFKVVDTILDINNTTYNFSTSSWNIVTKSVEKVNIKQNRLDELTRLKLEANRYINIPDIPDSLKTKITTYIGELNTIVIPDVVTEVADNNSLTILWPNKPWQEI